MLKINNDIFSTKVPYTNMDYFNNLSDDDKEKYLNLYSLYNELLQKYFIKRLDLKRYDDMLVNTSKEFIKVDIEDMDIYQYLSSDYLNFLYIRNNIYIERLTKEELDTLLRFSSNNNSAEAEDFIENTYKKVIFESDIGTTMYGPDNLRFIKPSNNIIIGMRHNAFFINEGEDIWKEKYDEKVRYLDLFLPELEKQLNKKISGVSVIEYNDFSIVKKNNKVVNKTM